MINLRELDLKKKIKKLTKERNLLLLEVERLKGELNKKTRKKK